MDKPKDHLTSKQITDARQLCELIRSIPNEKKPIFEITMFAYMNGMEAGMIYAQELGNEG